MFGGALGDLLPLAIGIAISPVPIIACILILFSTRARVNGPAFLGGWVLGLLVVTIVVRILSDSTGATDTPDAGPSLGDVVLLLLGLGAIALGVRQWRSRPGTGEETALPSWMSAIGDFTPGKAFGFGIVLSALNPKNLGLAIAAAVVMDAAIAAGGDALALELVFVIVASLSIAVPVLYLLVGGETAKRTLEGWRTWLAANNAAIMAVLFIVIGAKLVGGGLDAFLA
jgi:hypothetical protein